MESAALKKEVSRQLAYNLSLQLSRVVQQAHNTFLIENEASFLYIDDPLGMEVLCEVFGTLQETMRKTLEREDYAHLIQKTRYKKQECFFDEYVESIVNAVLRELS